MRLSMLLLELFRGDESVMGKGGWYGIMFKAQDEHEYLWTVLPFVPTRRLGAGSHTVFMEYTQQVRLLGNPQMQLVDVSQFVRFTFNGEGTNAHDCTARLA